MIKKRHIILIVIAVIIGDFLIFSFLFLHPIYIIYPGYVAVIENKFTGVENRVLEEGTHFIIPVIQKPIKYSLMINSFPPNSFILGRDNSDDTLPVILLTSDGYELTLEIKIKYRIDKDDIIKFHKEVDKNFVYNIIGPVVKGTTRTVASKYKAIELYTLNINVIAKALKVDINKLKNKPIGRYAFHADLYDALNNDLNKYYIKVEQVDIYDIKFPDEFIEKHDLNK